MNARGNLSFQIDNNLNPAGHMVDVIQVIWKM